MFGTVVLDHQPRLSLCCARRDDQGNHTRLTAASLPCWQADRAELQRLLDADSACCSSYGSNLGSDATRLRFKPEELAGCPESFLKDRTDEASGDVVLSLKYPDTIPVMNYCEVEASRERLSRTKETA